MIRIFSLISVLFLFSCQKEVIEPTHPTTANQPTVDSTKTFTGYRVSPQARQMGKKYWDNTEVMLDLYTVYYKNLPKGYDRYGLFLTQLICGDFNNDGYIDIFDAGVSFNGPKINSSFLIWNPSKLIFEDVSLFNDKTIKFIGGNVGNLKVTYLNDDNYVDIIVYDNGDEGIPNSPNEPIKIILSDGKGGYDLKVIKTNEDDNPSWKKEGGDIGDLNGDGLDDLVVTCNMFVYIYWGISDFPYFTKDNHATFVGDYTNFSNMSNNSFGEKVNGLAGNAGGCRIADVNGDGSNDLIVSKMEDRNHILFPMQSKIYYNLGKGRFSNQSVIDLPFFYDNTDFNVHNIDYIVDDINNDGKKDLICVNQQVNKKTNTWAPWEMFVYEQQKDGSFVINKNYFTYTISSTRKEGDGWKSKLVYYDYNGDGIKDVGYINSADNSGVMKSKTVFIRRGDKFIEEDFYQYDKYAKSLLSNLK